MKKSKVGEAQGMERQRGPWLKIGVLTGTLLLAGGGATMMAARHTEQNLRAQLQQTRLALESSGLVSFDEQPLQRTLLGATQETVVSVLSGDSPLTFTLVNHISNGPLPRFSTVAAAVIDTEVKFAAPLQARIDQAFGQRKPLIRTVVKFGGDTTTNIVLPSGSLTEGTTSVSWKTLSGKVQGEGNRVISSFSLPELRMNDGEVGVLIRGTRLESDQVTAADGLADGSSTATTEEIVLKLPGQALTLRQLSSQVQARTDEGFYSSHAQYRVNEVDVAGRKLSSVELKLSAQHLERASLGALIEHSGKLAQKLAGEASGRSMQALEDLLAARPQFALERLSMTNGGGELLLEAQAGLAGSGRGGQLENPQALLSALDIRASGRTPEAALLELLALFGDGLGVKPQDMLRDLTRMGLVQRQGDQLTVQLLVGEGRATLNGRPLPF